MYSPSLKTIRSFVASGMGYLIFIIQPKKNFDYNGNPIKVIDIEGEIEPGNITLT